MIVDQDRACFILSQPFTSLGFIYDHYSVHRNKEIHPQGLTKAEVEYVYLIRDMLPEQNYNNGLGPSFSDAMIYIAGGCV